MPGDPHSALRRFAQGCEGLGLNVQISVPRAKIDPAFAAADLTGPARPGHAPAALYPEYRQALVLGSAGQPFWKRFLDWKLGHTELQPDPLDRFTQSEVEPLVEALRAWDSGAIAAYPFHHAQQIVPFSALLGHQPWAGSAPFGVAVHPQFGPWFAWRAVLLTRLEAPPTSAQASPCVSCAAPCVEACPVQAVSKEQFHWQGCVDFRLHRNRCRDACQARRACPVGTDFRYGGDQMAFHYRASLRMLQRQEAAAAQVLTPPAAPLPRAGQIRP